MKQILVLLLLVSMIAGCSNVYSADEGYRMSLINYGFPVPKNAGEMRPEACTDEITQSAKYKLKNIGGENEEGPQMHYLNEIIAWGWTAMEEESSETTRYFEKESQVICVVFDQHVIDVFEMSSRE